MLDAMLAMANQPDTKNYSFSFLAGALFFPESVAIAELMNRYRDWARVARQALEQNIIRQRTAASRVRILREIRYRLEQLSREQLQFLCEASSRDQRHLLFLAMCQRFRFIGEFVEEVLRPKALALEFQIRPTDFARFFDRKAAEAPELDELTDKSRAKIKQVLIRTLAEAGLINSTADQRIQRLVPSKALVRAAADPRLLRFLLLSDAEIRQLAR
jgi:hypothetical protein